MSVPFEEDDVREDLRAVVFDLDGTLVDSRIAVIDAVAAGIRDVAERHGRGPVDPDPAVLRGALGRPAPEYFRAVLDANLVDLADEVKEAATAHEVRALAAGEGRLYDDVLSTLSGLRARGLRLASVSNAQAPYFRGALEHLDLERHFDHTECHEELPAGAPPPFKRTLLQRALRTLDVDPRAAAMVGDRREDLQAGRDLGCLAIGIAFGFGSPEELSIADAVIERFGDLPRALGLSAAD